MSKDQRGFTLAELLIGATMLAIAIAALLGAFLGQTILNEHARNLTWAINDANRVMERLRQQNTGAGCTTPSWTAPNECDPGGISACVDTDADASRTTAWDDWLSDTVGGGKSIQPDPLTNELVVVTATGTDPIQLTVAVCWRHRNRVIGECTWNGAALAANDADGDGVIDSLAMLSTVMTCRR